VIPRLLYITDGARGSAGRTIPEIIERAVEGGLEAVLLREFSLGDVELGQLIAGLEPLRARGLRVLVSRRLDLARSFGLDGVQLAADAVAVEEARSWLGADPWIGYSAHSGEEAARVAAAGANYVTLSPVYATESKPGAAGRGISWLSESIQGLGIPVLALGGVTAAQTEEILRAGAWGVAAVSAIGAAPNVAEAVRLFREAIQEATT